jgi:hypothetical protein
MIGGRDIALPRCSASCAAAAAVRLRTSIAIQ